MTSAQNMLNVLKVLSIVATAKEHAKNRDPLSPNQYLQMILDFTAGAKNISMLSQSELYEALQLSLKDLGLDHTGKNMQGLGVMLEKALSHGLKEIQKIESLVSVIKANPEKTSSETIALIDSLLSENKTASEISKETGLSKVSIEHIIFTYLRGKHKRRKSINKTSQALLEKVEEMLKQGKMSKDIAKSLGIKKHTVDNIVTNYFQGKYRRTHKASKPRNPELVAAIIEARKGYGLSTKEIADSFNINPGTVWDLLNRWAPELLDIGLTTHQKIDKLYMKKKSWMKKRIP